MLVETSAGAVDVPIPEGWVVVETGTVHEEDRYLVGGRHNAWMGRFEWRTYADEDVGQALSMWSLTIRQVD